MTLATFTFIKDFSEEEKSRYFMTDDYGFREVSAADVVGHGGLLICHDFWMIARALHSSCGSVPKKVVDLDEFNVLASRDPHARRRREKLDTVDRMANFLVEDNGTLRTYKATLYQGAEPDLATQEAFHKLLLVYYIEICRRAACNGELERFYRIEIPCAAVCYEMASRGIAIDGGEISKHRRSIRHEYYGRLKAISDAFDIPLEVPSAEDDKRYAIRQGVDLDEYSLEFALHYLPQMREYAEAVQRLRDLSTARDVLESIAIKSNRVYPTVDTQGARTSRISVRSPFLQSLPKRYRSVIRADAGKSLSYVDFDQFEVGIMAALSNDPILHSLFMQDDMYESFRLAKLGGQGSRKAAKILFLAYAYGMKRKNLPIVGINFGFDPTVVREAFKAFSVFENWKMRQLDEFEKTGYVSTSLGNRFYHASSIPTKKERLSAISQIVQGEGSLIFKKALIRVAGMRDVEILIPMHDAVLFQHTDPETPEKVVAAFVEEMTQHFGGAIRGKASIDAFTSAIGGDSLAA